MRKLILSVALITTFVILHAQTYNINTIAGNGTSGYSGDGGSAASAELNYPTNIAIDTERRILYIADNANNRIRSINISSGIITTVAGNGISGYTGDGGAATSAELGSFAGIAVDTSGNIYIACPNYEVIREVNIQTGIINLVAGELSISGFSGDGGIATSAELDFPTAVALDKTGNLYIADINNNRIRKVSKTADIITTIAGNGIAGYNGDGISATTAELYLSPGSSNGIVNVYNLGVDSNSNIYIPDNKNNRIRKVNTNTGIISTVAGNGTLGYSGDGGNAAVAELYYPTAVNIDIIGNIYIADNSNNVIRKVNNSGIISTIAGSGASGFSGDGGPAKLAAMAYPYSVATDNTNNVYIPDFGNQRIRELTINPSAINEISNINAILVYPNPNNGNFIIALQNINEPAQVEIYNVMGERVQTDFLLQTLSVRQAGPKGASKTINLTSKASGIYFYRVIKESGELIGSGKVVIEK